MGSRLWGTDWVLRVARWSARIVSMFVLMVAIVFVVGEGFPNPSQLPVADPLLTLPFFAMLVGEPWVGGGKRQTGRPLDRSVRPALAM